MDTWRREYLKWMNRMLNNDGSVSFESSPYHVFCLNSGEYAGHFPLAKVGKDWVRGVLDMMTTAVEEIEHG